VGQLELLDLLEDEAECDANPTGSHLLFFKFQTALAESEVKHICKEHAKPKSMFKVWSAIQKWFNGVEGRTARADKAKESLKNLVLDANTRATTFVSDYKSELATYVENGGVLDSADERRRALLRKIQDPEYAVTKKLIKHDLSKYPDVDSILSKLIDEERDNDDELDAATASARRFRDNENKGDGGGQGNWNKRKSYEGRPPQQEHYLSKRLTQEQDPTRVCHRRLLP